MIRIILTNNKSYKWGSHDNIKFRGYFIIEDNLYSGNNAIEYLKRQIFDLNVKKKDLFASLNGMFSIIIETDDEVFFTVDRLRGLPLFYSYIHGNLFISDNAQILYEELPTASFDPVSFEEFKSTRIYVSGFNTLYNEIKQNEAAEVCCFIKRSKKLTKSFYFDHNKRKESKKTQKELTKDFDKVFSKVSNNLFKALNGRTAVVPLSGGTDSRELLLLLHKSGYKDVICFSYGKKDNKEGEIARELAEHFEYKWIFIEYTRGKWNSIYQSKEMNEYKQGASNLSSLPHIQDFLAVRELKDSNLIPTDSVFLPGHTGAIIGGILDSKFLRKELVTYDEIRDLVIEKYYDKEVSNQIIDRIENCLKTGNQNIKTNNDIEGIIYGYGIRERQIKYICNSVRVYEFFGYEWLLPLCDNEFLDFMQTISLELKYEKKFIRAFMGLQTIPSTSDDSFYKTVSNIIRKFNILRIPVRKISKVTKYFFSNMQWEGAYGFGTYFRESIKGSEFFTIVDIESKNYIKLLKKNLNEK